MTENLTLQQYQEVAVSLPFVQPLSECCGSVLAETVHIEPLEGRNTLEVDRTCMLRCKECGRMYVSKWD